MLTAAWNNTTASFFTPQTRCHLTRDTPLSNNCRFFDHTSLRGFESGWKINSSLTSQLLSLLTVTWTIVAINFRGLLWKCAMLARVDWIYLHGNIYFCESLVNTWGIRGNLLIDEWGIWVKFWEGLAGDSERYGTLGIRGGLIHLDEYDILLRRLNTLQLDEIKLPRKPA